MNNDNIDDLQKKVEELQEQMDVFREKMGDVAGVPSSFLDNTAIDVCDPCSNCPNNPKNNPFATGVCHCTLPSMYGPFRITW